jgi:hypothetical protein
LTTWLGLDLAAWQTIIAAVAALGTVGAAVVAGLALLYFRSQATELKKANAATRAQVHAAVRPAITVQPAGFRVAHEFELTLGIGSGQPIRDVTASVSLEDRDVAAECVPSSWAEVEPVAFLGLLIRASGVAVGDRATLRLTYRDSLGSRVRITYPLRGATHSDQRPRPRVDVQRRPCRLTPTQRRDWLRVVAVVRPPPGGRRPCHPCDGELRFVVDLGSRRRSGGSHLGCLAGPRRTKGAARQRVASSPAGSPAARRIGRLG